MMTELEDIILREMPSIVLVHGDTNTTLAGALVASKISTTKAFTGIEIKLAHVEAGLRSYDRAMPEEINRVISDHLSDFLFAPTKNAKNRALREGIPGDKVFVTGNTIVDALYHGLETAGEKSDVLAENNIEKKKFFLLTLHRQENVDAETRLKGIIDGVNRVAAEAGFPIIFPVHPRTVKMFKKFNITPGKHVNMIQPCGFLDFLCLEANANLIFTDSGGVQEESCALKVPCVTLRTSTERPETVAAGANIVAGIDPEDIFKAALKMSEKKRDWENPFGNGMSAELILNHLKENR
jgi:UDP-N-acetylglucosamine 2-epimerase (non-hydrolysing)